MLGKEVAVLGTGSVEQPLAGQAAAGEGLQVDFAMVAGTDAHFVILGVNQNEDTFLLVSTQVRPHERDERRHAANAHSKPPQAHAACKGHADEHEHEHQRHAGIAGEHHVQTGNKPQVEHHVQHRGDA